tara:strand:- start:3008 stop:3142 length:135 start_codon:yes stop_codon:yes gene_type:complete
MFLIEAEAGVFAMAITLELLDSVSGIELFLYALFLAVENDINIL